MLPNMLAKLRLGKRVGGVFYVLLFRWKADFDTRCAVLNGFHGFN